MGVRVVTRAKQNGVTFKWVAMTLAGLLTTIILIGANAHTDEHKSLRQEIQIIQQDVKEILKVLK